jgi:hypothetical protein
MKRLLYFVNAFRRSNQNVLQLFTVSLRLETLQKFLNIHVHGLFLQFVQRKKAQKPKPPRTIKIEAAT